MRYYATIVAVLSGILISGCYQVVPDYPGEDAAESVDAATVPDAGQTAGDAEPAHDALVPGPDAQQPDAEESDSGHDLADAGATDAVAADATAADATAADATAADATAADATASPDSGVSDAGGRVPAFVLVGKRQRRAISYDDGQSWTHDVNADPGFRCGDCDHDTYSPAGLASTGSSLLHATGHGAPGQIFRSTDGLNWTSSSSGGPEVAALMAGGGAVVTAAWRTQRSVDDGAHFSAPTMVDFRSATGLRVTHARSGGFGGGGSGVFLVAASDGVGKTDLLASRDLGLSWNRPTLAGGGRADECGVGALIDAGPLVAMADVGTATVCWSNDLAQTLHVAIVPAARFTSGLVYTGSELMVWSRGKLHRSPDGAAWTTVNLDARHPDGTSAGMVSLGPVARSPNGTFVAVAGRYEAQRFYRSSDGVRWDELPSTAFAGGHPVTHIVWALVDAP